MNVLDCMNIGPRDLQLLGGPGARGPEAWRRSLASTT